ncbi:hypothetical protein [Burkholderia pseudomallei]|uniref:hypothetical protein n=1 Tax=Burkholderia pseudomallei TaxID=28450 RepID=UPI0005723662|nr:hypothetical protein [Burkholderia pseudomallei]
MNAPGRVLARRRAGAGGCIDFTLEIGYPKAESRKPKAEKRIADFGHSAFGFDLESPASKLEA